MVAGIQYGPVIRPGRRPVLDDVDVAPEVDEADRAGRGGPLHRGGRRRRRPAARPRRARDRRGLGGAGRDRHAGPGPGWLGAAEKLHQRRAPLRCAPSVAAVEQFVDLFTQLGGLMAERVTDLRDIRDRVIAELGGQPEPGVPLPDVPSVLVAEDLAPADTAGLDPALVVALATELGGPTSHTAIIARQLGHPLRGRPSTGSTRSAAGTMVLVDGTRGTVDRRHPTPAAAADAVAAAKREAELAAGWAGPGAHRRRARRSAILANVAGRRRGAAAARETRPRASACSAPSCASSTATPSRASRSRRRSTARCSSAFAGRKVVVRTLDAGSDKPLEFAGHPEEANPALGVRGLRIAVRQPRAAGAPARRHRRRGRAHRQRAVGDGADGRHRRRGAKLRRAGPRARPQARRDGRGAVPRRCWPTGCSSTSTSCRSAPTTWPSTRWPPTGCPPTWPPHRPVAAGGARAGRDGGRAGAAAGKPVGVCGEAAADPLLACVLVGLGVTSLSAAAAAVTGVGAKLSQVTLQQCRDAADAVLATGSAADARAAAIAVLG